MPKRWQIGFRQVVILTLMGILIAGGAVWLYQYARSSRDGSNVSRLLATKKPNILLITVDTTRADHLPSYGYKGVRTPNLDSLAKQGVLFRQCATTAPLTLPAHSSIMTGTYPTYHGVRINGNTALSAEHLTLAEEFSANGYRTGAFVGAFVLDGRWGLNQGFDHYDDQFDLKKYKKLDLGLVQRPANQVVDAALGWLDGEKEKPFFAWVHLYDPHTPYAPPEPYRSEYGSTGVLGLYDGEIAFMDEQIGRCLAWLNQNGLREKTIVVVMGDHGEGLGDHGEMTHGYFIYDSAVHVPFIMSAPVQEWSGLEIASQVRTIDLYPTLLQASGIAIPKQVQGTSLLSLIDSRGEGGEHLLAYSESMAPSIQYGWSPLLSLRSAQYKFIDAPRKELYDLKNDPGEERDIHQSRAKTASEYEKTLKNVVAETSAGAPAPNAANFDSETMERLAALGYIGASVKTPTGPTHALIDPKDRLSMHEAIQKAGELNNDEQYAESAELLEQLLHDDPTNPQARLMLASCYVELKRSEEAKSLLATLLDEDAQNIPALICLANILQDEGQSDEVIRMCKSILEVDERNTQALTMTGQAYLDKKNYAEAMPFLQKAVEIQPKMTQNQLNFAACLIGLGRYEEAIGILNTIISTNPKFPLAHFHLGLLYEEQGKLAEGSHEYQTEIESYPNCFVARFNLGRLQLRLGNHDGYMEQMREVIQVAPKNAAGYLFLARGLLQEKANPDEILGLTEQGLSLARSSEYKAMGYFLLADVYTLKKQPQQVKQALAKANEFKSQITNENM